MGVRGEEGGRELGPARNQGGAQVPEAVLELLVPRECGEGEKVVPDENTSSGGREGGEQGRERVLGVGEGFGGGVAEGPAPGVRLTGRVGGEEANGLTGFRGTQIGEPVGREPEVFREG